MKITCYCNKTFKDGLSLAKHRVHCRKFQVAHYHRTIGSKTFIPGTRKEKHESKADEKTVLQEMWTLVVAKERGC